MKTSTLVFILILFFSCSKKQKPAFLAGYYNSSTVYYRFEMYEDATFCLESIGSTLGKWHSKNDTFFLYNSDGIQVGKIANLNATAFAPKYRILEEMKLKKFTPAQIIKYPKPR